MVSVGEAAKGAVTALQAVGSIQDILRSARGDSLVEYSRTTRVEPIVFVDDGLVHFDYMPDVMQTLNAIFSAYYLQALSISVNVGAVDTVKLLDRLNPDRDPLLAASGAITAGLQGLGLVATENYAFGLPSADGVSGLAVYGDAAKPLDQVLPREVLAMESILPNGFDSDAAADALGKDYAEGLAAAGDNRANMTDDGDSVRSINENVNLSVGRLLDVTIEQNGHKAVIPVAVRLKAAPMSPRDLVHILTVAKKDTSAKERYHGWRSGALNFIRDIIFCQDLIDEHKKNLMDDAQSAYQNTMKRSNKNTLAAIVSGRLSLASASAMMVFKHTTAAQVESSLGGRFKDFKFREALFKKTYAMIMVVVDTDWDRCTIYTRSIEEPTIQSIKEMKQAGKNKGGVDVAEILKAYTLGSTPTI